jgi:hypothetical protein
VLKKGVALFNVTALGGASSEREQHHQRPNCFSHVSLPRHGFLASLGIRAPNWRGSSQVGLKPYVFMIVLVPF